MRIESIPPVASLRHRPDIDGLRAIAVIAVVAYHASKRISGGFIGVDVFFVISGFLISSIILNGLKGGSFSFVDFYVRRIRRIFPALILVLSASWLMGWYILEPKAYAILGKHIIAGAGFASNIILWSESGYFDVKAVLKPLLHLWSLGIEEQFYLFWPVLLFFAWKSTTNILVWIVGFFTISFVINILGVASNPVATFYLPFGRFWELLVGATLAYFSVHHHEMLNSFRYIVAFKYHGRIVSIADLASLLGLAMIVLGVLVLDESSKFPGWWALMPTLGAALLIGAGASSWINRVFLSHKSMTSIGLISYPLYLWHWPLLSFGRMTALGIEYKLLTTISMVTLSFVLSLLTYYFVEQKLRCGLKSKAGLAAPGLLGAMAVMMALGLTTVIQGGWSGRYPEAVRPFLDYEFDYEESFRNHRCLLAGSEEEFATECAGAKNSQSLMLIWGDSHGAMLYRALSEAGYAEGMSVAQFTSSSCPPVLDFEKKDRPLCRRMNDGIFRRIQELRPATVVLAHTWPLTVPENALAKLPETVARLRQAGIKKIVLVGPVPHWGKAFPTEALIAARSENANEIPYRIRKDAVAESIQSLDESMERLANSLVIDYVASYKTFCNPTGCLATIGSGPSRDLTTFDDTHLTPIAARFLVSKNRNAFFARASE